MSTENIHIKNLQTSQSDTEMNNLIVRLWELVRNASEGITELRSKYSELETKYRSAERSLLERTNYHEKSEQKLNSLEKKVEDLNSQLFAKDNHIQILSERAAEITQLKEQIAELEEQLNESVHNSNMLKEKASHVPKLTQELEIERFTNRKNELTIIELNDKIKELTTLNSSFSIVQKELAHKNFVIKEKSEKIEELKELLEINKSKVINLKNIETEKDDFYSKYTKLEEEYNLLKHRQSEDLEILNGEIEEKNNIINELNDKLQQTESLLDQLRNTSNAKEQLIKKLGDNLAASESKLLSLQSVIETNIAELNKLKSKNSEMARLLSGLKEQQQMNEIKDNQISEISHKLEETEAGISLLQKERDRLKKLNQAMSDELDLTKATLNNKLALIENLNQEIALLGSDLESALTMKSIDEQSNIENKAKIAEYETKIEELKTVISKISEQIIHTNALEKRVKELDDKINKLSNELTVKDVNLAQSREKNEDLEELLKKRYEQIKILELELNGLYEKTNRNKSKFADLSGKIDNYIMQIDEIIK